MAIQPSDYRYPVTIEKPHPGESRDEYGQENLHDSSKWVRVYFDRAAVMSISGREFFNNNQTQSEVTHKVFLRYSQQTAGTQSAWRIRWQDGCRTRFLHITAVLSTDLGRPTQITLMCKEATPHVVPTDS